MVVVSPFLWMVLGAFKTTPELRQVPPTVLPQDPTPDTERLGMLGGLNLLLLAAVVGLVLMSGTWKPGLRGVRGRRLAAPVAESKMPPDEQSTTSTPRSAAARANATLSSSVHPPS